MTLTIVPIAAMLVGLLMYTLLPNAKAQELGRLMFFAGMLAILLGAGKAALSLH